MISKTVKIHHFLLLDESHSMQAYRLHVIHHVNQTMHSIRSEALRNPHQQHLISILIVNQKMMRCIYTRANVLKASLLNQSDYNPDGESCILDGIGGVIGMMRACHGRFGDEQMRCNVFTVGQDTISSKYTSSMIAALVNRCNQKGWIFSVIGLGASLHSWSQSLHIPISYQLHLTDQQAKNKTIMRLLKRRWILDHRLSDKETREEIEAA